MSLEHLEPRYIYIKGKISGKYRGVERNSGEYIINLYEPIIDCNWSIDQRIDIPFYYPEHFEGLKHDAFNNVVFEDAKEMLPDKVLIRITKKREVKYFEIDIDNVNLYNFKTFSGYHQNGGKEVFGVFESLITCYYLCFGDSELIRKTANEKKISGSRNDSESSSSVKKHSGFWENAFKIIGSAVVVATSIVLSTIDKSSKK
jgi:hypothetical protein